MTDNEKNWSIRKDFFTALLYLKREVRAAGLARTEIYLDYAIDTILSEIETTSREKLSEMRGPVMQAGLSEEDEQQLLELIDWYEQTRHTA